MDKKAIVETLNSLIETSKDGEYGFRLSSEHAKSASLKQVLLTRAQDCAQAARELQSLVLAYGGKAESDGSTTGALHRGWVSLKGKLAGYSDLNMLEEVECGEDAALKRYREALRNDTLPPEMRSILEIHLEGALRNHNLIRDLRNQAREMSE